MPFFEVGTEQKQAPANLACKAIPAIVADRTKSAMARTEAIAGCVETVRDAKLILRLADEHLGRAHKIAMEMWGDDTGKEAMALVAQNRARVAKFWKSLTARADTAKITDEKERKLIALALVQSYDSLVLLDKVVNEKSTFAADFAKGFQIALEKLVEHMIKPLLKKGVAPIAEELLKILLPVALVGGAVLIGYQAVSSKQAKP